MTSSPTCSVWFPPQCVHIACLDCIDLEAPLPHSPYKLVKLALQERPTMPPKIHIILKTTSIRGHGRPRVGGKSWTSWGRSRDGAGIKVGVRSGFLQGFTQDVTYNGRKDCGRVWRPLPHRFTLGDGASRVFNPNLDSPSGTGDSILSTFELLC